MVIKKLRILIALMFIFDTNGKTVQQNRIFRAERLSNKGKKMSMQVKANLIKQIKTIY